MLEWDPVVRPTPLEIQDHRYLKLVPKTAMPSTSYPNTLTNSKRSDDTNSKGSGASM